MNHPIHRAPFRLSTRFALPGILLACGAASAFATQAWTRVTPPSGGTPYGLAVSPHDSDIMLAGLWDGIYRSQDGGAHWVGPLAPPFSVAPFSFDWHPLDPSIIMAGTEFGGRRSTDGGLTWDIVTFSSSNPDWVPAVRFDPIQIGSAFALAHDFSSGSTTLFHSADAGVVWTQRLVLPLLSYDELHFNADGDLILAGQMGIARSTDAGMSLEISLMDLVSDVERNPSNPSLFWAVGFEKLWSSFDGGVNWQEAPAPPSLRFPSSIVSIPGQSRGLVAGSWGGDQWISQDGGNHWREIAGLPDTLGIETLISSSAQGGTLWLGSSNGLGAWRSTDGGVSWQHRSQGLNARIHLLVTDFSNQSVGFAVGREGGLFVTEDEGASWDMVLDMPGRGVRVGEAVGLDSNPAQLAISDTSTSEARVLFTTLGSGQWQASSVPLLGNNPALGIGRGRLYVGSRSNGEMATSVDGGLSWSVATNAGSPNKIAVDPRSSARAHVGGAGGHYRTIDAGQSWTQTGMPFYLQDLAVDTRDSRKLFAVSSAGFGQAGFHRSTDGGTTWTQSAIGLPASADFYRLLVDDGHPQRVLIGSATLPWIWRSQDGGSSFARLPSPDPEFETFELELAPGNPDAIWAVDSRGEIWSLQL